MFLQIYGEKGKSDEIKLENNSDSFEQAQLDKFMVSTAANSSPPVHLTKVASTLALLSTFAVDRDAGRGETAEAPDLA